METLPTSRWEGRAGKGGSGGGSGGSTLPDLQDRGDQKDPVGVSNSDLLEGPEYW